MAKTIEIPASIKFQRKCKNLEEFEAEIRLHEELTATKYVVYAGDNSFHNTVTLSAKRNIRWGLDGVPYFQLGTRTYLCHQGKDKNLKKKKEYAQKRDEKACTDLNFGRRNKQAQTTKKVDCPARIYAKRVFLMEKFKVTEMTKYNKYKNSSLIKLDLKNNCLIVEDAILFDLPDISDHKHHFVGKDAFRTETIDGRVREKIKEFVRKGKGNAYRIRELIQDFVKTTLKIENEDVKRHRYNPELSLIRAIIKREKRKLGSSWIEHTNDQEENDISLKSHTKNEDRNDEKGSEDAKEELETNAAEIFLSKQELCLLSLRKTKRKQILMDFHAEISKLQSIVYLLQEEHIIKLTETLKTLNEKYKALATEDASFPFEAHVSRSEVNLNSQDKNYTGYILLEKLPISKNRGPADHIGYAVDMTKEYEILKIGDINEKQMENLVEGVILDSADVIEEIIDADENHLAITTDIRAAATECLNKNNARPKNELNEKLNYQTTQTKQRTATNKRRNSSRQDSNKRVKVRLN